MTETATVGRELIATRLYDASPERVYAAWENPEEWKRWWGPDGFTNTYKQFEFKEGGQWIFTMHGPDGTDYANEIQVKALEPARRIVLEHVGAPHFILTASFEDRGGKTLLAFHQLFDTAEVCDSLRAICEPANNQNLARLAAVLGEG